MMTPSRNWFALWLMAFLGFPPGGLLAALIIGSLDTPLEGIIGGLIAGTVIGGAQMLALRYRLPVDLRWIIATAVGLAAGVSLSVALFGAATDLNTTLLRALLTGLLPGVTQWFILRQHVRWALLWLPALTMLYPLAWFVTAQVIGISLDNGYVVFGASGALLFQALTGLTLWALLRLSAAPAQAH